MDDSNNPERTDDSRIDVNESYELQYWAETFEVSREELLVAVSVVGPSAEDVEKFLSE